MKKTYLITGAASGLGRTLTEKLFALGHECILVDKDLKLLNRLYDELHQGRQDEGQIALYPMNLLGTDLNEYQTFGDVIAKEFAQLDGVFLNAASMPAFTPIDSFDFKQWYEVLHTNLNANFHLIQQTLPAVLKAKGKIVALSDTDAFDKPAYYGAYGVAKAGLEQLLNTLSKEHCEKCLECVIARAPAFATETRGRLFPGENPLSLPQTTDIADELLAKLGIDGKAKSDLIEMNFLKN